MRRCLSGAGCVGIARLILTLSSATVVEAVQSLMVVLFGTSVEGDRMFSNKSRGSVTEAPMPELASMKKLLAERLLRRNEESVSLTQEEAVEVT